MLSKKTKYAIKALVALAKNETNNPMLIADIAKNEQLPKKFLEAILLELKHNGFVSSKKGAGGGYYMLKPAEEISLSAIIRIVDGPIAMLPCVSLNFYERCEECKDEITCGIRDVAKDVRDATLKILLETSIADIIKRESDLADHAKVEK
ncbi:RrF2 family transcriptional regulator [Solitalea canadensis]|uniref:Rrf2 family protein, putative transcriptional regulator n=1 Tax=Solitalea canadensis (strain ATCC 29591 / DSM 3403 / JCM 21819 / LMG 8368 / NBRC 15130 / NCIMB 12057 / USAM 9D) TaxID=929556 RepID=H8KUF5_SOLCM|nr:Rrf2 family transcriptional regulator [Solitalea canadensis]AFD07320.1 rrf2 family protein, putative transcriptional regulator [Solitalea canadensis DSM 3403]